MAIGIRLVNSIKQGLSNVNAKYLDCSPRVQITLLVNTKTSVLANNVVNSIGEQWNSNKRLQKISKIVFLLYLCVGQHCCLHCWRTIQYQKIITKNIKNPNFFSYISVLANGVVYTVGKQLNIKRK